MIRYLYTIILLFGFKMTNACNCVPVYNSKGEEVPQKVDLILKATVVRIDTIYTVPEHFIKENIRDSSGLYPYTVNIRVSIIVHRYYKGKNDTRKMTLITGQGDGDCGYPFKLNKQYLIYGVYKDLYLFANDASGTDITKERYFTTNVCTKTTGL